MAMRGRPLQLKNASTSGKESSLWHCESREESLLTKPLVNDQIYYRGSLRIRCSTSALRNKLIGIAELRPRRSDPLVTSITALFLSVLGLVANLISCPSHEIFQAEVRPMTRGECVSSSGDWCSQCVLCAQAYSIKRGKTFERFLNRI